ncbi:hypothetical protein HDU82_008415 [Entophlyctis luteolus]|nr:hypothetical protein HDU82_008415 [Entophlyctis luteolus]
MADSRSRTSTLIFRRNIPSGRRVASLLNVPLSPASLRLLASNEGAFSYLEWLSLFPPADIASGLVQLRADDFVSRFSQHAKLDPESLSCKKEDILAISLAHLLLPFSEILADYMAFYSDSTIFAGCLDDPIRIKTTNIHVIEVTQNCPLTPFVLAMIGKCTSSAAVLAQLKCKIDLPSFAAQAMLMPWNDDMGIVMNEFKKSAMQNSKLWKQLHPTTGANFLGMLAAVPRSSHKLDERSQQELYSLLEEFLLHNTELISEQDTKNRNIIKNIIINDHRVLFDWYKQKIISPTARVPIPTVAKIVSEGHHECLEQWIWRDGSPLVPFAELRNYEWKRKRTASEDEDVILNYIPQFSRGHQSFYFSNDPNCGTDHVEIYSVKFIHMAYKHVETVKFFIAKVLESPSAPLKFFDLRPSNRSKKGSVNLLELALSFRADETAKYLLNLNGITCLDKCIAERARYLLHQLTQLKKLPPELKDLVLFFLQHPKCRIPLYHHVPQLPLLLRKLGAPLDFVKFVLDFENNLFSVNTVINAPNKRNIGTYLHFGVKQKDVDLILLLLSYQNLDLKAVDGHGHTPLHLLAASIEPNVEGSSASAEHSVGHEILDLILQNSSSLSDLEIRDGNGLTPLMLALIKMEICGSQGGLKSSVVKRISNRYSTLSGGSTPKFNYWIPGRNGGSILHQLARVFINLIELGEVPPKELGLKTNHLSPVFEMFSKMAIRDCLRTKEEGSYSDGMLLEFNSSLKNEENCTALDLFALAAFDWEFQNKHDKSQAVLFCVQTLKGMGFVISDSDAIRTIFEKRENLQKNASQSVPNRDPRLRNQSYHAENEEKRAISQPPSYSAIANVSIGASDMDLDNSDTVSDEVLNEDTFVRVTGKVNASDVPGFIRSVSIDPVASFLNSLSQGERRDFLRKVRSNGRILLHEFADTTKLECRMQAGNTNVQATLDEMLRLLSEKFTQQELDLFDKSSLTPLATSVFRDAHFWQSPNALCSLPHMPPLKSAITFVLESRGCSCKGTDDQGRNVVHGIIQLWIDSCKKKLVGTQGAAILNPNIVSAAVAGLVERGANINTLDFSNHTPMDLLLAQPGPSFLNEASSSGAINWTANGYDDLRSARDVLISSLRMLGAKSGLELLVGTLKQSADTPEGNFHDSMSEDSSDFSSIIKDDSEIENLRLVENSSEIVHNLLFDCKVPRLVERVHELYLSNRESVSKSRNELGNLPIHCLAASPGRLRIDAFRATAVEESEIRELLGIVQENVSSADRESFNFVGLNPMALSILADACIPALFVSADQSPQPSLITLAMENIGFKLSGTDKNGRNVIHGAVRAWLERCLEPFNKFYGRVSVASVSAAIKAFVAAGIDINGQDCNNHTPLDLLVAEASQVFGEKGKYQFETFIAWSAPGNRLLKADRDILVRNLVSMRAVLGVDLEITKQEIRKNNKVKQETNVDMKANVKQEPIKEEF